MARKKQQSDRPRDEKGRFISMNTLIFDETGTPDRSSEGNRIFGVGATLTKNASAFGSISKNERKKLGKKEMKHRNSTSETKEKIESEISKVDHEITLIYVDKTDSDNPRWWNKKGKRSGAQKKMLQKTAEEVMGGKEDDYIVVIDNHTMYKPNEACGIVKKAAKKKGKNVVRCYVEDSETGAHKDLLQTNDFAIGIAGKEAKTGKKNSLKIKIKRLTRR